MGTDSVLRDESFTRLTSIDPILASPVVPADAQVLEVGGTVGWTTEAYVDPDTMRASWGKLHQFDLYPAWTGDALGLDALVAAWTKRIKAGNPGPDSQAMVTWPSRDVDAARVLRAHGLTPGLITAVRLHPKVSPGRGAALPSEITVRPAYPGDLDAMVELFMEEMRYAVGLDTATIRASTRRAGRAMLAGAIDRDWVWVAEVDARVCGLLRATKPGDPTFGAAGVDHPVELGGAARRDRCVSRPGGRHRSGRCRSRRLHRGGSGCNGPDLHGPESAVRAVLVAAGIPAVVVVMVCLAGRCGHLKNEGRP